MHGIFGEIIASMPRDYEWIVIEEEKIPLVASMTKDYEMWITITGVLIIFFLVLIALSIYGTACEWKRRRLMELEERYGHQGYEGWNLIRLRREVSRLEMETIESEKSEPKMVVKKSY